MRISNYHFITWPNIGEETESNKKSRVYMTINEHVRKPKFSWTFLKNIYKNIYQNSKNCENYLPNLFFLNVWDSKTVRLQITKILGGCYVLTKF